MSSETAKKLGLKPKRKSKVEESNVQEKKPKKLASPSQEIEPVHSSNDWESADFKGDDDRKAKFLKLMGAAKEHEGKFVIGEAEGPEKQSREGCKAEGDLEQSLEDQFRQNMTDHLKHRDVRHRGLGWHGGTQVDLRADECPSSSDAAKPTVAATFKFKPMSFVSSKSSSEKKRRKREEEEEEDSDEDEEKSGD